MQGLTIYRSSAGSGKTYTLVKEYLLIALQYPMQFRNILALTFTNKATAEMKGRIIKTLGELAAGNRSALSAELDEALNLPNCTLRERSQEVLTNILHQYSHFAISTIDSFFNEIVKSLAHELKLSLRFEIELDQDHIINQAAGKLFNHVGKDKELTRQLQQFILYKMEDDKGWKIKDEILKIGKRLFDDNLNTHEFIHSDETYSEIAGQLQQIRILHERTMAGFGIRFKKIIHESGFSIDDFAHRKSGIAGYLNKIIMKQIPKEYKPGTRVMEVFNDSDKWLSKEKRSDAVLVNLVSSQLHPLLIEVITFHQSHFLIYNSAFEALRLIFVAGILSKLNTEIIHYRDENNVITLSDANKLIRSSVSGNDTPLVFEKTGNFYSHFLLDEFQDTSTVQWGNIRPLIGEALAGGKSALIVGDVKQSIYRWRGGNMELLHQQVEKDFSAYKEQLNFRQLAVNYRSSKEIIDFNNKFFTAAAGIINEYNGPPLPVVTTAYAENQLHQILPVPIKENGYIKINIIKKEEDKAEEHWRVRSMEGMLSQIHQLESLGYSLGDMIILVRNNVEGNETANFLYKNGIHRLLSNDSLLLSKSPQVIFLINCLRILIEPSNVLVRKEMEWFLKRMTTKPTAMHSFFSLLNGNDVTDKYLEKFRNDSTLPVDELITAIINYFNLNDKADAYIQRLQDVIIEYLEKGSTDIKSFVNWWDDQNSRNSFSVIMPSSNDALQIMTIHKSKGLQFPVVFMPFVEWKLKPKAGETMWAEGHEPAPFNSLESWPLMAGKALEDTVFRESYIKAVEEQFIDNLNLLYVAFTRPEQQLHITVLQKGESKEKTAGDLVIDSLNLMGGFDTDAKFIEIGNKKEKEKPLKNLSIKNIFSPNSIPLNNYTINSWQHKLSLKSDKKFTSEKIEFGLLVHQALSLIFQEHDADVAINKVKHLYNLTEEHTKSLRIEINYLLELSRPHQWFNNTYFVKTEAEFVSGNGKLLRPDRIMFRDKKAIIVDFKTGAENKSYHQQANDYRQLMIDCGYNDVTCWLVYTSIRKITEVD